MQLRSQGGTSLKRAPRVFNALLIGAPSRRGILVLTYITKNWHPGRDVSGERAMTQDIAGLIGAVTREVTGREHDGRPARVVRASRTYDTTMEDVWDAITNAERI